MRIHSQVLGGVLGAWLVLGGSLGASAEPVEDAIAPPSEAETPATEADKPATEATEQPAEPPPPPVSVPSVRRDMEEGMSTLGELASDAKRDSDLVRAACVLDKQERAQGVMELATGEMLVIRDEAASAEARGFAAEKLAAASDRLGELVEQAKECVGDKSPEASDDETRNEVEEEPTIPIADPTMGGGVGGTKPPRMPPPVNEGLPPSVSSPSV